MRAIDAFVNVRMGSGERPDYLVRVAEDYFKRSEHIFRDISVSEMVELMDRIGVEKSILSLRAATPDPEVLAFTKARPDRFVLAAYVDPRRGMPACPPLGRMSRGGFRIRPTMVALYGDRRSGVGASHGLGTHSAP